MMTAMSRPGEDSELLAAWRTGDRDAGAALFERHYEAIARFFRNKVNGTSQDDLVQQTFLRCAERAAGFRGASSFRTFLFGIAHNVLREYLRKVGRQRERDAGELDLDALSVTALGQQGPGPAMSATGVIASKQEQRLLLEGLRTIALHHQVALELHYWEQLSVKEIAEITGKPVNTIKTRLRDGRIKLARKLSELAESEELLRSTLDDLEGWAARMRGEAFAEAERDGEEE